MCIRDRSRGSIGSISVEDYTITIHLIKKSGGHYVAAGNDAIMNREGDTEEKVTVGSTVTDRKETPVSYTHLDVYKRQGQAF